MFEPAADPAVESGEKYTLPVKYFVNYPCIEQYQSNLAEISLFRYIHIKDMEYWRDKFWRNL